MSSVYGFSGWIVAGSIAISAVGASPQAFAADEATAGTNEVSEASAVEAEMGQVHDFDVIYYSIFQGPSLSNPTAYQPLQNGEPDTTKPLLLKNYLGLAYNVNSAISITPTAYWGLQNLRGQPFEMRDPFLQVSDNSVFYNEGLNLYSDLRFHAPVSASSRSADLLAGVQTVQALTYQVPESRTLLGLYGYMRYNVYGPSGIGKDLELYVSPNVTYQVSEPVALTCMYEVYGSHNYGQKFGAVNNDGTDLEPGVSWNLTPSMNLNPYLNLNTSGKISLASTAIGALFSWRMI